MGEGGETIKCDQKIIRVMKEGTWKRWLSLHVIKKVRIEKCDKEKRGR